MRFWLAILVSLALSGCALLRHDAVVRGVFPPDAAFLQGVPVEGWEEWEWGAKDPGDLEALPEGSDE